MKTTRTPAFVYHFGGQATLMAAALGGAPNVSAVSGASGPIAWLTLD